MKTFMQDTEEMLASARRTAPLIERLLPVMVLDPNLWRMAQRILNSKSPKAQAEFIIAESSDEEVLELARSYGVAK